MDSIEYVSNTYVFKKSKRRFLKAALIVCAALGAMNTFFLVFDAYYEKLNLIINFMLPAALWYLALKIKPTNKVDVTAIEYMEKTEDGVRLFLPEIDRGDGLGTHKEYVVFDRDRTENVRYQKDTDEILLFGEPYIRLICKDEKITMDCRQNNRKYTAVVPCREESRQQMFHMLQIGLGMDIEEVCEGQ